MIQVYCQVCLVQSSSATRSGSCETPSSSSNCTRRMRISSLIYPSTNNNQKSLPKLIVKGQIDVEFYSVREPNQNVGKGHIQVEGYYVQDVKHYIVGQLVGKIAQETVQTHYQDEHGGAKLFLRYAARLSCACSRFFFHLLYFIVFILIIL